MKPPTAPMLLMNEKPMLACSPGRNTAGQEKNGPAVQRGTGPGWSAVCACGSWTEAVIAWHHPG